jgi:hypothetical protein
LPHIGNTQYGTGEGGIAAANLCRLHKFVCTRDDG